MAETKEALLARYEELRDKEDATWQAWRILNRSRTAAFDAWLAAARGGDAVQVEVVTGPSSTVTPCGFCCSDAGEACATCTPQHPAEVCHPEALDSCTRCEDCREAA
jgi:hypothetical protein